MKMFLSFLFVSLLPITSVFGESGNQMIAGGPATVVTVAVGSKDHTTLVTALKAADLVNAMSNPGPFTVFAPTNAAFDALPKGTVEKLLKPENKKDLINILQYHVFVGKIQAKWAKDGQRLNMVNGGDTVLKVEGKGKDKKISINGAHVIASIDTANGVVHVIDAVLLQPAKK